MKYAVLFLIISLFTIPPFARAEAILGQPAPALTGEMLDGSAYDLAAMRGKVVLVHFWATWCGPCQQEMPEIDAFYRKHHGQGLEMIAISADRARDSDKVKEAMKAYAFPAAMLSDVTTNGFGNPSDIPITYVVDAAGVLRAVLTPEETTLTEQDLSKVVSPYLRTGESSHAK